MPDSDVVIDDLDSDSPKEDERKRRGWILLAAVALLLLLLFACVSISEVWLIGGEQQARFVARNLECLQCHTELIPDFNKPSVHNPFALKECTTCHTPHGKEIRVTVTTGPAEYVRRFRTVLQWLPLRWWLSVSERSEVEGSVPGSVESVSRAKSKGGHSGLVAPEEDLCWTCHGSMGRKLGDTYQHQPFETGRCTSCHDPHASDFRVLLTQAPNKICFTCHPIGQELNRKQAHSPVAQGWCIDCHDPHASNFKGMIVARQRELCFRCHPTVAVKTGMPVQHVPFLNDNCTGCHEAHGSDFPPLLDAVQPDLCYKCHPQIENQFTQPSHHPVGVTLTCGSCHDPHAAQYPGLVAAQNNDFCYRCHGQMQADFADSDHDGRLCIRCHTPHGSPYTPILVDRNPDLCFGCHKQSQYDGNTEAVYRNKHPVRPNHYDANNQSPLTCTSSCHNPHGSDKSHMLRYFSSPYDGACLMCHAVTRGARVGIDY